MKYAMVPINRRYDEKGNRIVRRVLISYDHKNCGVYEGTKLLELDEYFKNPASSHQYIFEDDSFTLVSNAYLEKSFAEEELINEKRRYEFDGGKLFETAYEFEAADNKAAIKIFKERNF